MIDELLREIRRIDRLAGGYAIVEMDLAANGLAADHPGLAFVREQRARVEGAFSRAKDELHAAQAACSHAFELIGEAKPPFHRCVRCYTTRSA